MKRNELSHTSPAEIPPEWRGGGGRDVKRGAKVGHSRRQESVVVGLRSGTGNDPEFFHLILIFFQDVPSFQTLPPLHLPFPYISKSHQFFRANSDMITDLGPTPSVSVYG